MRPIITVIHHNDPDGIGAAWCISKKYSETHDIEYFPIGYGAPVPNINLDAEKTFILDFSFSPEECDSINESVNKLILIDHHITAANKLKDKDYALVDTSKAGCALTWEFCFPGKELPQVLKYIQDRDMWWFRLPNSRQINAYIQNIDLSFVEISCFDAGKAAEIGYHLVNMVNKQIDQDMKRSKITRFYGFDVPMVNATQNISDLGERMNKFYKDSLFSVSYMSLEDGSLKFSLRSDNKFDVAEFAKQFGGGGHKNAAGFVLKMQPTQETVH
jgi:oligoribonuclease NrnB/cAMP/cGMP phosphodiesterase (DHH superfamily)